VPDNILSMTAGAPFHQRIRMVGVKSIWSTVELLEVRAQMRVGPKSSDDLIVNLHDFMTYSFVGDDLVIDLDMTGGQTRALYTLQWGPFKKGYFNVIASDVGVEDARSVVVPTVTIQITGTTTSAEGNT
jgi:hypothetical protein